MQSNYYIDYDLLLLPLKENIEDYELYKQPNCFNLHNKNTIQNYLSNFSKSKSKNLRYFEIKLQNYNSNYLNFVFNDFKNSYKLFKRNQISFLIKDDTFNYNNIEKLCKISHIIPGKNIFSLNSNEFINDKDCIKSKLKYSLKSDNINFNKQILKKPAKCLNSKFKSLYINNEFNIEINLSIILPMACFYYENDSLTNFIYFNYDSIQNKNQDKVSSIISRRMYFGLVLPFELAESNPIPLLNSISCVNKKCNVEYFKYTKSKKLFVKYKLFERLIYVYNIVFSKFLNNIKEFENIDAKRLIYSKNCINNSNTKSNYYDRNYFVVPLKYINQSESHICIDDYFSFDTLLYDNLYDIYYKKIYNNPKLIHSIEATINILNVNVLNFNQNSCDHKNDNKEILNNNLNKYFYYYNSDKQVLDLKDVLYKEESVNDFLFKVSRLLKNKLKRIEKKERSISDIRNSVINKNFIYNNNHNSIESIDRNNNNSYYLCSKNNYLNLSENLDSININMILFDYKTKSSNLMLFREFHKNNLYKSSIYCIGDIVKPIDKANSIFNKNLNIKNLFISAKENRKDYVISKIYSTNDLRRYPITKENYKEIFKIKSLLINFEQYLKINEFINLNVLSNNYLLNNNNNYYSEKIKPIHRFMFYNSLTSNSCLYDYDYQTLETIGDSVLKFLCTLCLYYKNKLLKEGNYSILRQDIVRNSNLFNIADKYNLLNYCNTINLGNIIDNWFFPLQVKDTKLDYYESLGYKSVLDIVEAIIGAYYYLDIKQAFSVCLNFKLFDSIFYKEQSNNNSNYLDKDLINKISCTLTGVDDLFIDIKSKYHKIYHMLSKNIQFDELYKIYSNYDISANNIKNIRLKNQLNSDYIYKLTYYKFNNVSILEKAFSPKIISNNNDFERLEFIGDSIIDFYLMSCVLHIAYIDTTNNINNYTNDNYLNYDNNIYLKNKNLNPNNLTFFKSYLASNRFMAYIMVKFNLVDILLYKLNEYLSNNFNINSVYVVIDKIKNYMKNIELSKYSPDNYMSFKNSSPKILSDCLEAFIGAIFIDSKCIRNTFKVLNTLYIPIVLYCIKYINYIKVSPLSDLINKFSINKLSIIFEKSTVDDIINKNCSNNKQKMFLVKLKIKKSLTEEQLSYKDIDEAEMFLIKHNLDINTVIAEATSNTEELGKELCCIDVLNKYFV